MQIEEDPIPVALNPIAEQRLQSSFVEWEPIQRAAALADLFDRALSKAHHLHCNCIPRIVCTTWDQTCTALASMTWVSKRVLFERTDWVRKERLMVPVK